MWIASKNLSKLAAWEVFGRLFHPIYTIVNAAYLGHAENSLLLTGFGLGSLTIGIFLLSIGYLLELLSEPYLGKLMAKTIQDYVRYI
jgi:hypothetical protein